MAAQLARRGGATVIGTVTRASDVDRVDTAVALPVALDQEHEGEAIRAHAPDGVDRIIEVALSDNADLDAEVIGLEGIIAAYASRHDRLAIPFWPMLFANVTVRLIGSNDFPLTAKRDAVNDLTIAASEGALSIAISDPLPLERIAEAHDRVDAGTRQRILLTVR